MADLPAGEFDSTIAIETLNYQEGTNLESVRQTLQAVLQFDQSAGPIEIIIADVTGDPAIVRLAAESPRVHYVDATGLGYDEAKARAAQLARGRLMVYLDCDCVPEAGWFEHITDPLRRGTASATTGFPDYGSGYWTKLYWLMDFAFMLPRIRRQLGCYSSNNSAFIRDVLLRIPEPEGPMRCRCYAHAQLLARAGYPPWLIPDAAVRHEPPAFWRERLRQGYDMIAACWTDEDLPEARWLRYGVAAAFLYYRQRVRLDWAALNYHEQIGLSSLQKLASYPLLALARLIDLVAISGALAFGPEARRWFDHTYARLNSKVVVIRESNIRSEKG